MKTIDARYIRLLKKYDSATVCNVIELFKARPQTEGFLHHSIRCLFPELPPMVGYAVTCTFTSAREGEKAPEYNNIGRHVRALQAVPTPRVMVFQDLDDDPVGASFGEMLAATYLAFGCVGIITSGGARDTVAIRKRRLPLFAAGLNVSHGYPRYLEMNVPVKVGGIAVRPGDLLHGDADGVTTVPPDLAPRIALMCEKFTAMEEKWAGYADSGKADAEGIAAVVAEFADHNRKELTEINRRFKSR